MFSVWQKITYLWNFWGIIWGQSKEYFVGKLCPIYLILQYVGGIYISLNGSEGHMIICLWFRITELYSSYLVFSFWSKKVHISYRAMNIFFLSLEGIIRPIIFWNEKITYYSFQFHENSKIFFEVLWINWMCQLVFS